MQRVSRFTDFLLLIFVVKLNHPYILISKGVLVQVWERQPTMIIRGGSDGDS